MASTAFFRVKHPHWPSSQCTNDVSGIDIKNHWCLVSIRGFPKIAKNIIIGIMASTAFLGLDYGNQNRFMSTPYGGRTIVLAKPGISTLTSMGLSRLLTNPNACLPSSERLHQW
jgi:hypothetical protein